MSSVEPSSTTITSANGIGVPRSTVATSASSAGRLSDSLRAGITTDNRCTRRWPSAGGGAADVVAPVCGFSRRTMIEAGLRTGFSPVAISEHKVSVRGARSVCSRSADMPLLSAGWRSEPKAFAASCGQLTTVQRPPSEPVLFDAVVADM